MDYMNQYNNWLANEYFDTETKEELLRIKNDADEIKERFYKDLDFGTGGLRGIIGAGTNRINIYTIRKATQGFANYLIKNYVDKKNSVISVAIAHDSRRMSPEFAKEAALVLNGNGIKTYLYDSLRSTPQLSFAVRHLGCEGGIVITASHNPPEYNGYKVYGKDGGQVPYPYDNEIINEVNKIDEFSKIKIADEKEAAEKGLFNVIGAEVDDKYIKTITANVLNKEIIENMSEHFNIVYTPLHGTGNIPVRKALAESGFKNVYVVPEQAEPDSNFITVGYPNPEDPKVFELAIALAEKVSGDIIIATDPDADRIGCAVKDAEGKYQCLSGNMVGVLLAEYILSMKKEKGILPENAAVISTIVSTKLTKAITESYGGKFIEVLTGFKYIGEKIKEFEETGSNTFIFGFEESYGYLAGTHARDKDAVEISLLLCEMAAFYKNRSMTLLDGLQEIYKKYGYFSEKVEPITLKGIKGQESIKKIMEFFRESPPERIGAFETVKIKDYKKSTETNLKDSTVEKINLPVSDVLCFEGNDESWFAIRPSGTEPKIKVYFGAKAETAEKADKKTADLFTEIMKIVEAVQKQ